MDYTEHTNSAGNIEPTLGNIDETVETLDDFTKARILDYITVWLTTDKTSRLIDAHVVREAYGSAFKTYDVTIVKRGI